MPGLGLDTGNIVGLRAATILHSTYSLSGEKTLNNYNKVCDCSERGQMGCSGDRVGGSNSI